MVKISPNIVNRLNKVAAVLSKIEEVERSLETIGHLLDQDGYVAPARALTLLQQLGESYNAKVANKLWDQLVKDDYKKSSRVLVLLSQVIRVLGENKVEQVEGGEDLERKKIAVETHEFFKKLVPYCTKMVENLNRLGLSEEAETISGTKSNIAEIIHKLSKI